MQKAEENTGKRMNPMGERLEVIHIAEEGVVSPAEAVSEAHECRSAQLGISSLTTGLMERISELSNLERACRRVVKNGGSAGVDGMTTAELEGWFASHWRELQEALLRGNYEPSAVRGVRIPKPKGGYRQLGIPTVKDRLVQQAVQQVLSGIYEPVFSNSSYGYRPGRGGQDAVRHAGELTASGRVYVVDLDIEKFFDKVNHDRLLRRLGGKIGDKRVLSLIGKYLRAGLMEGGIETQRKEGTPQGGPLSPLLSNIVLDELDKELEKRGHGFVRYADDIKVFVRSERAAERVKAGITKYVEDVLRLKLSATKSRICRPYELNFLGHTILKDGRAGLSEESEARLKKEVRKVTRRNRGVSLEQVIDELNSKLMGWLMYFRTARMKKKIENLEGWIRRRLRCYRLKQCKRTYPMVKWLCSQGVPEHRAWLTAKYGKGWWRKSGTPGATEAMTNEWFARKGLLSLTALYTRYKT